MSGSVGSAGCRFLFGKRVVRVCLRTRYYTNSCVHCYGYIIVDGEGDARGRWHRSGGISLGGWRGGRQRKVASLRAGTPSGDTTRAP